MNNNTNTDLIRLQNDAKKIYRWKNIIKILAIILALLLLLSLCLYFSTSIITSKKSFPITLMSSSDELKAGKSISLSETEDFAEPTVNLKASIIENLTCISEFSIPLDIDAGSGSHNGTDYIAYTFYLRNNSDIACKLSETMKIESSTRDTDEAVRIRVYRNGIQSTYAKTAANGEPEFGTTPFSGDMEIYNETADLQANQVNRYTIVIWLEGDDPECIDSVKGGSIRLFVEFNVIDS